ncbi:hypothetical protein ALC57_16196 [Trachymyrmex cornetzi]|uniref:Uncharacterized protein n=1 Tax=Trachymyrmex cornetzi TaxID=471704 RepID=A0A195DFD8_9HYME|nr:hypothetical protein ALC57_16196 [Trachymyrmex cornetzi]
MRTVEDVRDILCVHELHTCVCVDLGLGNVDCQVRRMLIDEYFADHSLAIRRFHKSMLYICTCTRVRKKKKKKKRINASLVPGSTRNFLVSFHKYIVLVPMFQHTT